MDNRIAELAKTIYEEGVEKAKEEARRLVAEAERTAAETVAKAKAEAEALLKDAEARAEEMRRNTEAELRLSGQQAMAVLRNALTDMVTMRAVERPVKSLLSDPGVLKSLLVEVMRNWRPGEGLAAGLEVLLPEASRKELEQAFEAAVRETAAQGVEVRFTDAFRAGFQLVPKGEGYKLSMTDEDFAEFFKAYLRPRIRDLLFGKA